MVDGPPETADATATVMSPPDALLRPDLPPVMSCGVCPAGYAAPLAIGKLDLARLDEASGLAASRVHPGVYYSHNDRGNRPELVALSQAGIAIGIFALTGAPALDVEDVALGPCPGGTCLYLADTGNNRRDRDEFALYRIAEPDVRVGQPFRAETVTFERFPLRYEDGAHDVESLLVDPVLGTVYLITKPATGPSTVYKLPLPLDSETVAVARKMITLPVPRSGDGQTTAASAHPCAPRFLLRTYRALYEFRAPAGGGLADAFAAPPIRLTVANEPVGEAVSYRADGLGFVTVSEGLLPPVYESRCAP